MSNNSYIESLPKKRMAAGALLFNLEEEVLLVKPTYKDSWEIPGGSIEVDESPLTACLREVKEELNLSVQIEKLVCVDYTDTNQEITESLHFIFLGPLLEEEEINSIVLPADELSEFRFVTNSEAFQLLEERLRERVKWCLEHKETSRDTYLENAKLPAYEN